MHRRHGGVGRFGLLVVWCPQCRTLIRHAAASGPKSPAAVGVQLPSTFAGLVSATGLPLPATPHLRGTIAPTVNLATITSAADNNLSTTAVTKKEPWLLAALAAKTTEIILQKHSL